MPQKQETVLVIDDDVAMCGMLTSYLSRHGWMVRSAYSGEAGIDSAAQNACDLIIVDVMLPGIDGFEVLRRLNRINKIPVLLLTARGEDIDRIIGLEMGADDYLAKPFNPRELLARMKAILRRSGPRETVPMSQPPAATDFLVNEEYREISYRNREVPLTDTEYLILAKLLLAAPKIILRDELFEHVFGRVSRPFDRSLDMHLSRLRRKLSNLEFFTGGIKTIRSNGFVFVSDSQHRQPDDFQ